MPVTVTSRVPLMMLPRRLRLRQLMMNTPRAFDERRCRARDGSERDGDTPID